MRAPLEVPISPYKAGLEDRNRLLQENWRIRSIRCPREHLKQIFEFDKNKTIINLGILNLDFVQRQTLGRRSGSALGYRQF